jgi:hypothetical protein
MNLHRPARSHSKTLRAIETEALLWGFVSDVPNDPTRLEHGLHEIVKQEKALVVRGVREASKRLGASCSTQAAPESRSLDAWSLFP